jgi:hypothetical protein
MIHQVADEKRAGYDKRTDHCPAVLLNALAADQSVAPNEKNGSHGVQEGIYRRKDDSHNCLPAIV